MTRRTLGLAALVVALALVAAGCSDKKKKAATTTTTTTLAPGPSPLVGSEIPGARLERPVLIVKIDNSPKARPQSGINQADVVVEQMVEGGQTRFAAIFQSTDAADVGPVRSGRSSDVNYFSSVNRPLFAYSGANSFFKVLVRKSVFFDVGFERLPDAYRREGADLYTSTTALYEKAPELPTTAPSFWAFRAPGASVEGDAAGGAAIEFKGRAATRVEWLWDAAAKAYKRSQDGAAHVDKAGAPVTAANVVIQFSRYKDSGQRDQSGAAVPELVATGEGELWVLTDGKLIKGRWKRTSVTKPVEFLDQSGKPLALTPGRSWIELPPEGSGQVRP